MTLWGGPKVVSLLKAAPQGYLLGGLEPDATKDPPLSAASMIPPGTRGGLKDGEREQRVRGRGLVGWWGEFPWSF